MLVSIFSIFASISAIVTYLFYIRQIAKGNSTPNPATIFIWFAVGAMNALTFIKVVSGDIWKSLIFFTTSGLLLLLFFYSLFGGKFAPFGKVELFAVLLAIGIGIFWRITGNATVSNLLLQIIYIISFLPVLIGLSQRKLKEKPFAWTCAVIAYVFATTAILLKFDGNWFSLVSPIVVGIMGNGSVALLSYIQNKRLLV